MNWLRFQILIHSDRILACVLRVSSETKQQQNETSRTQNRVVIQNSLKFTVALFGCCTITSTSKHTRRSLATQTTRSAVWHLFTIRFRAYQHFYFQFIFTCRLFQHWELQLHQQHQHTVVRNKRTRIMRWFLFALTLVYKVYAIYGIRIRIRVYLVGPLVVCVLRSAIVPIHAWLCLHCFTIVSHRARSLLQPSADT